MLVGEAGSRPSKARAVTETPLVHRMVKLLNDDRARIFALDEVDAA